MAAAAVGTVTKLDADIKGPNDTIFVDEVSFAGPADYSGDGISGLETALNTLVGGSRKILSVVQVGPCSGYVVFWDAKWSGTTRGTGVLRVYYGSGGSPAAAGTEVTTGTLAGVTFRLQITSK
jgi:hypothetical protein